MVEFGQVSIVYTIYIRYVYNNFAAIIQRYGRVYNYAVCSILQFF